MRTRDAHRSSRYCHYSVMFESQIYFTLEAYKDYQQLATQIAVRTQIILKSPALS